MFSTCIDFLKRVHFQIFFFLTGISCIVYGIMIILTPYSQPTPRDDWPIVVATYLVGRVSLYPTMIDWLFYPAVWSAGSAYTVYVPHNDWLIVVHKARVSLFVSYNDWLTVLPGSLVGRVSLYPTLIDWLF